jgi:plastocyanin
MPDGGWLVTVIMPLAFAAFVVLWILYLAIRYRRAAAVNVDRRPRRLDSPLVPPSGVHASPPSWWPIELSVGFFIALLGLVVSPLLVVVGLVVTLLGGRGWLRSANREWRRAELAPGHGAAAHALVPAGATALQPAGGTAHEAEPPPGVHMPAPSWWPIYASAAAFLALLGLVVNPALLVGGIALALLAFLGWYRDSYRELKVAEGLAPRPHGADPRTVYPRFLAPIGIAIALVSVVFAVAPGVVSGLFPAGGGGTVACTPPASIEITAQNTAFSTKTLCLPAGVAFSIVFHNMDAGVPHNVSIIGTDFNGEVFNGPATKTYQVPPIAAGTYPFLCIVHPTVMKGTATVVAAAAGP